MAPGIVGLGTTVYDSAHNLIKAHAKAYHIYDKEFRPAQKGIMYLFVVICVEQAFSKYSIFKSMLSVFCFNVKCFKHRTNLFY